MTAVVYERYGGPEQLRVEERPIPTPKPDQVLIEVEATSINLSDWETLHGTPLYARIGGLRRPGIPVLGSDIAGRVVDVGAEVTAFGPGDEVYGDNLLAKGGFAQYAVAPESELAIKPTELSFAQASTIPQAAAIATQGTAPVKPSSRVLINGAGGGSGMFAIQLAKRAGAHVTAVDNNTKLEFMIALGADEVIDYQTTDFTRTGEQYDHILDMVATRSPMACRRAMAEGGRYRCVGGSVASVLGALVGGAVVGRLTGRNIGVLAVKEGPEHFEPLAKRCATGEINIHIDRTFRLEQVSEALAHHGGGHALGKVVVAVGQAE